MQCEQILKQLDDYLDGELAQAERRHVDQHLPDCANCQTEYHLAEELLQQCRNQPAVKPRTGYEARMLSFLERDQYKQPSKPRLFAPGFSAFSSWFTAGFGSAVAALLLVWFIVFDVSAPTQDNMPIMTVELPSMQSRKVDLVFNSPHSIHNAAMTIELPAGTELVGYPGRRILNWQTSLKQGSNRLSLPIIMRGKQGGTLLAKISHQGQTRTFKLELIPMPSSSQQMPVFSS